MLFLRLPFCWKPATFLSALPKSVSSTLLVRDTVLPGERWREPGGIQRHRLRQEGTTGMTGRETRNGFDSGDGESKFTFISVARKAAGTAV